MDIRTNIMRRCNVIDKWSRKKQSVGRIFCRHRCWTSTSMNYVCPNGQSLNSTTTTATPLGVVDLTSHHQPNTTHREIEHMRRSHSSSAVD